MSKIVLVRPNYKSHMITPPLGLGYLASCLQTYSMDVLIMDGLLLNLDPDQLVHQILDEAPDAVGITCMTAYYPETIQLAGLLRRNRVRTIIGGMHPTFLPVETLHETGCDFVIAGEGEVALRRLIEADFHHRGIPGIYTVDDIVAEPIQFTKAERIDRLDSIPFPDWKQINPSLYPRAGHVSITKHYPCAPVLTSRGCPCTCTFCAGSRFYDRTIRFRSPEHVVEEIILLVKDFGVREIHFEDDNLTLEREHIESLCRHLIRKNIGISWACPNGIRADTIDKSLVTLMKKSGCYYIAYGIESGDPDQLQRMKKHENLETLKRAIHITVQAGITCQGFFIFGMPGETKETMKKSIRFAKHSKLSRAQFFILDILPGSDLWDTLKGRFDPPWKKDSFREPDWLPEGLTRKDLVTFQAKAFRQFYLFSIKRLFKLIVSVRPGQLATLFHLIRSYRFFH